MRSVLVVIPSPGRNADSGFGQRTEPVLVEAFIPELAVDRLDEGILRGLARLNQLQFDVALIGPLIERLAGELGTLVGADRLRVAPKVCHFVQSPGDVKLLIPCSTRMPTDSLVKSSTTVRHLIRRPVLSASKTKSIDQTWFGALGRLKRSRSTATPWRRLRRFTIKPAARYRR